MKTWTYLNVLGDLTRPYWTSPAEIIESLSKFTSELQNLGIDAEPPREGQRIVLDGRNDTSRIEMSVRELQERYLPSLILGALYAKDTVLNNSMKQVCDVRCGMQNVNISSRETSSHPGPVLSQRGSEY